jgi:hypothetical protein
LNLITGPASRVIFLRAGIISHKSRRHGGMLSYWRVPVGETGCFVTPSFRTNSTPALIGR